MKQFNTILKSVCIITTLIFSTVSFGQENEPYDHKVIDKNSIYRIKGSGFENVNEKMLLVFSQMSTKGEDAGEVSLSNNEITVNKSGVYRVSLLCNLTEEELQNKLANYSVNLNGKEVFGTNYHSFPESGKYEFQVQLEKGDKMSFGITRRQEYQDISLNNTLEIRFTDPDLITIIENH